MTSLSYFSRLSLYGPFPPPPPPSPGPFLFPDIPCTLEHTGQRSQKQCAQLRAHALRHRHNLSQANSHRLKKQLSTRVYCHMLNEKEREANSLKCKHLSLLLLHLSLPTLPHRKERGHQRRSCPKVGGCGRSSCPRQVAGLPKEKERKRDSSSEKTPFLRSRKKGINPKGLKPKLFGPDIFGCRGGLPLEGVGAKKFGMSSKTRGGNQILLAGYPGILAGYPGGARKV